MDDLFESLYSSTLYIALCIVVILLLHHSALACNIDCIATTLMGRQNTFQALVATGVVSESGMIQIAWALYIMVACTQKK